LPEYVAIRHVGIEEKRITPIFISDKKIDMQLDSNELNILKMVFKRQPTVNEIGARIRTLNRFVIVSKKSYQWILYFILHNKQFYTNDINKNRGGPDDYNIELEDTTFSVFYDYKDTYFKKFIRFLKTKKCDRNLIDTLQQL
jgi:hypothetical protein